MEKEKIKELAKKIAANENSKAVLNKFLKNDLLYADAEKRLDRMIVACLNADVECQELIELYEKKDEAEYNRVTNTFFAAFIEYR